jgi:hypothetical protein
VRHEQHSPRAENAAMRFSVPKARIDQEKGTIRPQMPRPYLDQCKAIARKVNAAISRDCNVLPIKELGNCDATGNRERGRRP